MKLTEHFTLEEFLVSQTAARLGIDNSPTPEHLENLKRTAADMEIVRAHFALIVPDFRGIIVSSGYRSSALNAAVPGSSKTSAHPSGNAVDFHIPGVPNIVVCCWIRDNMTVDQIIYEFGPYPRGWVHMGRTNGTPRRQALTAYKGANGTKYEPGIIDRWGEA